MTEPFKYWAFISYSSRNKAWGEWLHRALETYQVFKPLVGRATRMELYQTPMTFGLL